MSRMFAISSRFRRLYAIFSFTSFLAWFVVASLVLQGKSQNKNLLWNSIVANDFKNEIRPCLHIPVTNTFNNNTCGNMHCPEQYSCYTSGESYNNSGFCFASSSSYSCHYSSCSFLTFFVPNSKVYPKPMTQIKTIFEYESSSMQGAFNSLYSLFTITSYSIIFGTIGAVLPVFWRSLFIVLKFCSKNCFIKYRTRTIRVSERSMTSLQLQSSSQQSDMNENAIIPNEELEELVIEADSNCYRNSYFHRKSFDFFNSSSFLPMHLFSWLVGLICAFGSLYFLNDCFDSTSAIYNELIRSSCFNKSGLDILSVRLDELLWINVSTKVMIGFTFLTTVFLLFYEMDGSYVFNNRWNNCVRTYF